MQAIFNVVLPIFALIGVGYLAVRIKLYPLDGVKALMAFVNNFATPCLVFQSMLGADFSRAFNPLVLVPFFGVAMLVLCIGAVVANKAFRKPPGEAVASGFAASFSNTLLMGFPIAHRAYGDAALPVVFSIISLHALILFTFGTIMIELLRRDGRPLGEALSGVARNMVRNPLICAVALGVTANLLGVKLPEAVGASVGIMAAAVMPVALFGLGGALNEYRLADSWRQALAMSLLKLIVQPLLAWIIMVPILGVDPEIARYGVLLAAMPAGINVYIFATMYRRAMDIAASVMLISTVLSIVTVSAWLVFLG